MIYDLSEYNNMIQYTKRVIHDWDALPEIVKEMPETQEKLAIVAESLEHNVLSKENPPIVITAIVDYR